ncbi:hypothetical protein FBEOM_10794 [Fusarium beomiforme]|uniref:WSC domain-containing protein n=1 Tax=Fusarium beomiforme TaxID=44412 RepID=A0A9P5AAQ1_9HYPO|nr:hypothetical protein FBEOM_10794 [Fusarium beomiforme]
MLALRTTLALLFISAASAIPTVPLEPRYDINGQLLERGVSERATGICLPSDPDVKALKSNKAAGSAFCSTYMQSTKTVTVSPLVTTDITKLETKKATLVKIEIVRLNIHYVVRQKVMSTFTTTVTDTSTAVVTDYITQIITGTQTNLLTDTDTTEVTEIDTQQMTNIVTQQVTTTITTQVDVTSTVDVTDAVTKEATVIVRAAVTVSVIAPAPTVEINYHCAVAGFSPAKVIASTGSVSNWDQCKQFCSATAGAVSLAYAPAACNCYRSLVGTIINRNPSSPFIWYDLVCPAANKPWKRAGPVDNVPAYLPVKNPQVVSSACSCHISNKPAATTKTVTARVPKTVANTVKKYTTVYSTLKRYTTVTNQFTTTATNFQTTAQTGHNTLIITTRQSSTVITPVTVTITNYNTVIVTNVNTVGVTNYNTIVTTNLNTAYNTDYNTVVVTDVDSVTVTDYNTITSIATVTSRIIAPTVTVMRSTIYGS